MPLNIKDMSENKEFKSLLIVIPTRNRADFAIRAAQSVLEQKDCNCRVLISDNSTDEEEVQKLSTFCKQLKNDRLQYIRPSEELTMTKHWNWAMEQALELTSFSHISYLSDRTIFLKNRLKNLQKIIVKYSDKIISYTYNTINDDNLPVVLFQPLQTGQVFEVKTSLILKSYANVQRIQIIPKLVNCVVPRSIVTRIKDKTGNYFSSVSPDYNFAFNCLSIVDSVLFYDSSLLLSYGLYRSTGNNMLNGNFQKDSVDFIKNMNNDNVCFNTPVKSYLLTTNAIIHEYTFGKQSSKSEKFEEVNQNKYNLALVRDIKSYKNLEMKKEMLSQLSSTLGVQLPIYSLYATLKRKTQGFRIKLFNILNPSNPYLKTTCFDTVEQAIEYADDNPRKNSSGYNFIRERIGSLPTKSSDIKVLQKTD